MAANPAFAGRLTETFTIMKRKQDRDIIAKQRHCGFCIHGVKAIDYKDPEVYRRYLSSYGKIVPRRKSGVCSTHQRMLAQAIKRARVMALIPFLKANCVLMPIPVMW